METPKHSSKKAPQNKIVDINNHFTLLERVFIWLSGADVNLLRLALTEKQKFISLGSVVLVTGFLAYFTMLFALLDILKLGHSSFFISAIWALCIVLLDRYILASASFEPNLLNRVYTYIPRFVVAFLISLVISEPILLKVFNVEVSKEVKSIQIQEQKNRTFEMLNAGNYYGNMKQIRVLDSIISVNNRTLEGINEQYLLLTQQRIVEINGKGGSGTAGYGINAKKIDETLAVLLSEKSRLQIVNSDQQKKRDRLAMLSDSLFNKSNQGSSLDISNYDGILVRIEALSKAQSKALSLSIAVWLLRLLLMSIELTPVIYKLVSKRSLYDDVKDKVSESNLVLVDLINTRYTESCLTLQRIESEHYERSNLIAYEQQEILNRRLISAETSVLEKAIATWESDRLRNIKKEYMEYFKSVTSNTSSAKTDIPQVPSNTRDIYNSISPQGVKSSIHQAFSERENLEEEKAVIPNGSINTNDEGPPVVLNIK